MRDMIGNIQQRPADQAVAVHYPVIEKAEGPVRDRAMDPQRDLAQLDREQVLVHSEHAAPKRVAPRLANVSAAFAMARPQ